MSDWKKFFVWVVSQGEAKGEELEGYLPKDVAESIVSKRMPGIFEEAEDEDIPVDVRDPDGVVHHFDVHVDIGIRARTGTR